MFQKISPLNFFLPFFTFIFIYNFKKKILTLLIKVFICIILFSLFLARAAHGLIPPSLPVNVKVVENLNVRNKAVVFTTICLIMMQCKI